MNLTFTTTPTLGALCSTAFPKPSNVTSTTSALTDGADGPWNCSFISFGTIYQNLCFNSVAEEHVKTAVKSASLGATWLAPTVHCRKTTSRTPCAFIGRTK
eukprot:6347563-Amphidinium_carterae.1